MTEQRRYKSEAFESLHSACTGLHRVGMINDAEMQVYDQLPQWTPQIRPLIDTAKPATTTDELRR